MAAHWILVTTQQGKERLAVQNISRQGYDLYLPMMREWVMRQGQKIEVARPLFPRYVFVFIRQQWSNLTGTYGVAGLVMDGKAPRYVPERIIKGLREREDESGFVLLEDPDGLRAGQKVRIDSGVLQGQIGIYQGMSGDERAIVLFNILGGERRLPVSAKILTVV
jgi:transcriptional antiterminator RfaH